MVKEKQTACIYICVILYIQILKISTCQSLSARLHIFESFSPRHWVKARGESSGILLFVFPPQHLWCRWAHITPHSTLLLHVRSNTPVLPLHTTTRTNQEFNIWTIQFPRGAVVLPIILITMDSSRNGSLTHSLLLHSKLVEMLVEHHSRRWWQLAHHRREHAMPENENPLWRV